jgi:hypothetical protein
MILLINKPGDKWYSANFHVDDSGIKRTFPLAVNHPVSYGKWRFYLMSYGQDQHGQYLILSGRRDPGRMPVIAGIWMLITGVFLICLLRRNKEPIHAST